MRMSWVRKKGKSADQEERNLRGSSGGLGFAVTVVVVAGVLAPVATLLVDAYLPIPVNNAIYLGLLVFLFVLFVIFPFAVSGLVQGQGIAAIKSSLWLLLLGLFVASDVGSLSFLWYRLRAVIPWIQDIPWGLLLVLWLTADDLRRTRSRAQDDPRPSWKNLIFLDSILIILAMATLSSAVSRFSDGKVWLAALHLAIALLFGLLAVSALEEIWKRRRQKSNESIEGP
jgi:hypothetical protein